MQLLGTEPQRRLLIRDQSAIGEARRDAQRLASDTGLDETVIGRVGVVASELATNLLRHAGGGELMLQPVPTAPGAVIELIAIDRGPGMPNVETCLRDGYSSGGTSGTGLGAVKRLATEFDVYSVVGRGTVVMARVGAGRLSHIGAICAAKEGESECGDGWRLARRNTQSALMVVDGLGHGTLAAEAARLAAEAFQKDPFDEPRTLIERMHQALSGTRGAAGACAHLNGSAAVLYAGIGNIAGRLADAESSRGLVSHSGTLGFQAVRVQQFEYPVLEASLLIMHSDGLSARWEIGDHPGLQRHHPAIVAAVLYRDHCRGRDDSTVVVLSR
jgi:anti-sigma regulatory factor (Ser/Thr protein kinase)